MRGLGRRPTQRFLHDPCFFAASKVRLQGRCFSCSARNCDAQPNDKMRPGAKTKFARQEDQTLYDNLTSAFFAHISRRDLSKAKEAYSTLLQRAVETANMSVLDHQRLLRILNHHHTTSATRTSASTQTIAKNENDTGTPQHIQQMGKLVHQLGTHANLKDYSIWISSLARNGDLKTAVEALEEMTNMGVHPDTVLLNIVIRASVRHNMLQSAMMVYNKYLRCTDSNVQPDMSTFALLIKGHVLQHQYAPAIAIFKELQSRLPTPYHPSIYAHISRAYDSVQELHALFHLIMDHYANTILLSNAEAHPNNIEPLKYAMIRILGQIAHMDHIDTALELLDYLESKQPPLLSTTLYSGLMRECNRHHHHSQVPVLLTRMIDNARLTPNVTHYTHLVNAYSAMGKTHLALEVLEKGNVAPNINLLRILITGLLKDGVVNHTIIVKFMNDMILQLRDWKPSMDSQHHPMNMPEESLVRRDINAVINALLPNVNKYAQSLENLIKASCDKFGPTQKLMLNLLRILASQPTRNDDVILLWNEIKSRGWVDETSLLVAVSCFEGKSIKELEHLIMGFDFNAFGVDDEVKGSVLKAFANTCLESATRLFNSFDKPSLESYHIMLTSFLRMNKREDAMDLYSRLCHEHLPNPTTFSILVPYAATSEAEMLLSQAQALIESTDFQITIPLLAQFIRQCPNRSEELMSLWKNLDVSCEHSSVTKSDIECLVGFLSKQKQNLDDGEGKYVLNEWQDWLHNRLVKLGIN